MGLRSNDGSGVGIVSSAAKTMLAPYTCTMVQAIDYAQTLKRSFGDIGENESVTLEASAQEFLIAFLTLTHLNGDRIELETAEITIAPKPPNCDRPGTSQTCYYIRPHGGSQFQPVWFADCRDGIRTTRVKGTAETVAV